MVHASFDVYSFAFRKDIRPDRGHVFHKRLSIEDSISVSTVQPMIFSSGPAFSGKVSEEGSRVVTWMLLEQGGA